MAPEPDILPYGAWPSPITAASLVEGAVGITEVVPDGADVWWAEFRPSEAGRTALMRWQGTETGGETAEITPPDANVRTLVHEYGGGAWWAHEGVAYYVDVVDQRLRRLEPGGEPVFLTPEPEQPRGLRYADGRVSPDGAWFVCVQEVHGADHAEPVNRLVAVATDGSMAVNVLADGADFYACPRPSPSGDRLAWVQWNHPNMPWDDTELWWADLDGGSTAGPEPIVGGGTESIWQPEWDHLGQLYYLSDRSDLWWLYRLGDDDPLTTGGEITTPGWVFGTSRYALDQTLDLSRVGSQVAAADPIAVETIGGVERLALAPELTMFGTVRANDHGVAYAGASWSTTASVWRGDQCVRPANDHGVAAGFLPEPESITFATSGGAEAHALFYAPANPDVAGPPDAKPPLLVLAHGGPTSAARAMLDLAKRYWTSRGIAVVDVNYRGSVGYGRAYRNQLRGQWGIADVDDCVHAARYLVDRGDVDGERLLIKGGSAGGFTVLAALVRYDDFAAGASRYGVADLEALATDTHKFESRYLDLLIGPYPE
ncbi:MAG: S9 family peptidase, partial [Acidimicrobiales bacterium]|nr:S9 family peptidase [Acidimicrobiales bacterium]